VNVDHLEHYSFDLPKELIAQEQIKPRDSSRLLLIDKKTGSMAEVPFHTIKELLEEGDSLVVNETKVIPARLYGKKASGANVEALLIEKEDENVWTALLRPSSKFKKGAQILFEGDIHAEVIEELEEGKRKLLFKESESEERILHSGHIPLPPYIREGRDCAQDKEDYQCVFAKEKGSVAAPTAGLHFTEELIEEVKGKGVSFNPITLHVGLGTFFPIRTENIKEHTMHKEKFYIPPRVAQQLNAPLPPQNKEIVVGTTTLRALEASSSKEGLITPGPNETDIFIYPGYTFRHTKALLTNFHLPSSSLFILICAFMGTDLAKEAYQKAIEKKFRFFSYGDAMLIV